MSEREKLISLARELQAMSDRLMVIYGDSSNVNAKEELRKARIAIQASIWPVMTEIGRLEVYSKVAA